MIMAAITPYLALGKTTPLILVGLNSSFFSLSSIFFLIQKKRAPQLSSAQIFIFYSEIDTEVAAGYVSNSLSNKKSLKDTLTSGLKDLDGFYTFITGTRKGFAVVRDEIACKPAVIAETKNYVAIASEFQAMAHLPEVNSAKIFEPEPGIVYSWGK